MTDTELEQTKTLFMSICRQGMAKDTTMDASMKTQLWHACMLLHFYQCKRYRQCLVLSLFFGTRHFFWLLLWATLETFAFFLATFAALTSYLWNVHNMGVHKEFISLLVTWACKLTIVTCKPSHLCNTHHSTLLQAICMCAFVCVHNHGSKCTNIRQLHQNLCFKTSRSSKKSLPDLAQHSRPLHSQWLPLAPHPPMQNACHLHNSTSTASQVTETASQATSTASLVTGTASLVTGTASEVTGCNWAKALTISQDIEQEKPDWRYESRVLWQKKV